MESCFPLLLFWHVWWTSILTYLKVDCHPKILINNSFLTLSSLNFRNIFECMLEYIISTPRFRCDFLKNFRTYKVWFPFFFIIYWSYMTTLPIPAKYVVNNFMSKLTLYSHFSEIKFYTFETKIGNIQKLNIFKNIIFLNMWP